MRLRWSSSASMCSAAPRRAARGRSSRPASRMRSMSSSADGPTPHSDPADDNDTRSFDSVTLASRQPSFSSPTSSDAGMRTSSKNTWLNECAVVMSTIGLIVMPGRSIGQMKYEMPLCLGWSGSVRAIRIPNLRVVGAARPDLRPVDDVLVAIPDGPAGKAGQVGAGVGLGEQLAPHLLAAEDRRQVAGVLLGGAGEEDRRRRPADADRIARPARRRPCRVRRR